MSSDFTWPKLTLKEAGVTLIDCDHKTPKAKASGYPYIAIPQLKDGHVKLDGSERRISAEDFEQWTKKLLPQESDVIVVRRCNSGQSAHVPKNVKWAIGQNLVVLRADGKRVYPPFLRWLLRGDEWWEQVRKYINVGAVFDSLKCREIPLFELTIPPMKEQIEFAQILNSLDDRIALLRETNATLEAIAQTLFKSWFVDFDPVHANAGTQAPSLPAEIQALFPSRLVESPQGLIPEGWEVGTVADLGDVICGKTPPTSKPENYGDDVPFITIPDMHGKIAATQTARSLSKLGADTQPKKYLRPGSICVSCIATPGLVTRVTETSQTNQQINSVVPFEKWGDSYPLFAMQRVGVLVRSGGSGGSVFHNLSKSGFERIPVLLPSEGVIKHFDKISSPLVEQIIAYQKKAQTLAELRDTLLPRLISGQLRLPEAEAELSEVM
ncbi:MAG: restriction endonuclease subunit S [Alkalimonas sp.]|nr:restriction endonuclease subunit S [Alkalimonas sp.]